MRPVAIDESNSLVKLAAGVQRCVDLLGRPNKAAIRASLLHRQGTFASGAE